MAEGKKSFILYADLIEVVKKLPKGKRADLFMAILEYVNGLNPKIDDLLVSVAFEPVKQQLKRDLVKWEEEKGDRSENGIIGNLKRWHKDLYDKVISKEIVLSDALEIAKHRKASPPDKKASPTIANIAVNDTVTVTVTDTVNVNVNDDDEKKFSPPTSTLKNIEILKKEFLADEKWHDDAAQNLGIEKKDVPARLEIYHKHLIATKNTAKTFTDYASHFLNFTRKKLNGKSTNRITGSDAQVEPGKEFGSLRANR